MKKAGNQGSPGQEWQPQGKNRGRTGDNQAHAAQQNQGLRNRTSLILKEKRNEELVNELYQG